MNTQLFSLLCIGLVLCADVRPAVADISPPTQSAASGVAPVGTTKVQMVSERVEFDLRDLNSRQTNFDDGGSIPVSAEFVMLNRGSNLEQMQVQFPLDLGESLNEVPDSVIQDLIVVVDGRSIVTTTVQTERVGCQYDPCQPVSWAVFDVAFPPNQPVLILIEYHATAVQIGSRASFSYLLETGAGWYGPIGQATLVARLPYMAEALNVTGNWALDPTVEYRYNEARWYAQSIEPTSRSNIHIKVVYSDIWQSVLAARAKLAEDASDAQAHNELGVALDKVALDFHGFLDLKIMRQGLQEHETAWRLQPKNAEYAAAVARSRWIIDDTRGGPACPTELRLDRVMPALRAALELDPDNARAKDLQSEITFCRSSQ